MRDRYDEIQGLGGKVVAIGTGNRSYAAAFVQDEHVPFPVLVDDDGDAASAAGVQKVGFFKLLCNPKGRSGMRRAKEAGHKIHKPGGRVTQLGATFVVGPGSRVRYEHLDEDSADHAPLHEVIGALSG